MLFQQVVAWHAAPLPVSKYLYKGDSMRQQPKFLIVVCVLFLLIGAGKNDLAPHSAYAQDGTVLGPSDADAPQAVMAASFTYQGQLRASAVPVTNSCDFQF